MFDLRDDTRPEKNRNDKIPGKGERNEEKERRNSSLHRERDLVRNARMRVYVQVYLQFPFAGEGRTLRKIGGCGGGSFSLSSTSETSLFGCRRAVERSPVSLLEQPARMVDDRHHDHHQDADRRATFLVEFTVTSMVPEPHGLFRRRERDDSVCPREG